MLPELERRVVVCVGCGGVGKTTVAASIALAAARAGRRALVITIDPARRLADALHIGALGNQPEAISRETLSALGVPDEGSMSAMMLDMKRTFDDLVQRFAENEEARDRVLANPIYRHVSDALAGSVEYSAMEKVYELSQSGAFDTLVVDTPPSQHALDFLDAPERLLEFLDSRLVQMWIHPAMAAGRVGMRWFQWGSRRAFQLIERVTGLGFLEDVSEFLLAFEHMSEGFRDRAHKVRALMFGPEAAFVLVSTAETESVKQSQRFLERLEANHVNVAGLVANRVRTWPDASLVWPGECSEGDEAALAAALATQADTDYPALRAARAAIDATARYAALVRRDALALASLRGQAVQRGGFFRVVPEFSGDVHDLAGVAHVAGALDETEDASMAEASEATEDGRGAASA
jgi:anion-transporting  ArsA/GET3 family ATPase